MKQTEKSQRSKKQIILAAAEEFGSTPFENASLNQICQRNNISKGRLYHHFDNKDALFLACLDYAVDKIIEYSVIEFDSAMSLEEKYHRVFVRRQDFVLENPHTAIFLFRAFKEAPRHLLAEIGCQHKKYRAAISKTLLSMFESYPWFKKEQLPIFTEIFVLASNRVHEIGLDEWSPYVSKEKQKKILNDNMLLYDELVHIFLYGILPR